MKRLEFDSAGKLIGVDGLVTSVTKVYTPVSTSSPHFYESGNFEPIKDNSSWSLYENGKKLEPLKFSNGKTQQNVVDEVVSLIKEGKKVIFIHGGCGTGKSAIALNIARAIGRASIVVPIKNLQKQYEEDYSSKKYVLKPNGEKLKISMITGRDNHDSIFIPGSSCNDPTLPDTIKIVEKNWDKLMEYYKANPFIQEDNEPKLSDLKRISVAPANPYWSPIIPSRYELYLPDAKKKKYKGLEGKEFVFYHRKRGCGYYDQYQAYIDSDVIIFNAAKYKIEVALDRKPYTEVDIIDEADEFLDSFSSQQTINLTRFANSLVTLSPENPEIKEAITEMLELIKQEETQKRALGVDETSIFSLKETRVHKLIKLILENAEIEDELLDETNYVSKVMEIAHIFRDSLSETYVTYSKDEKELMVNLVTTNLARKFDELVNKNRVLVLMSGTLQSETLLKDVFGVKDFAIVNAETEFPGVMEICRTGKEFDCKYSNFQSKRYNRGDYLKALEATLQKAQRPTLVHVNAYEDLPTEEEMAIYNLKLLIHRNRLRELQSEDDSRRVSMFKAGLTDVLFTTRCSRGVDFPGKTCNSVIFTKYPNPNVNDIFWKVMQKTHPQEFWEFYRDKAYRELLQRIYRALRFKEDHAFILSVDTRVLDEVASLQRRDILLKKQKLF